jgi:hypothetical protein
MSRSKHSFLRIQVCNVTQSNKKASRNPQAADKDTVSYLLLCLLYLIFDAVHNVCSSEMSANFYIVTCLMKTRIV